MAFFKKTRFSLFQNDSHTFQKPDFLSSLTWFDKLTLHFMLNSTHSKYNDVTMPIPLKNLEFQPAKSLVIAFITLQIVIGRGKELSSYEKGVVEALSGEVLSARKIAARIGRSNSLVPRFIMAKESYGQKMGSGRPQIIPCRARRQLFCDISNTRDSVVKVKARNNIEASRTTVWRAVKREGHLTYTKSNCSNSMHKPCIEVIKMGAQNINY